MMVEDRELSALAPRIWERWTQAVDRKGDPFRTVALATSSPEHGASARMVVLRAVEPSERWLEFHTDARSGKIADLSDDPRATLLFWDPAAQLQLRAEGRVALYGADTREAAERFAKLGSGARRTYRTEQPAGVPLERPEALRFTLSSWDDPASTSFVVARLTVERIDWLQLSDEGQRRAEIVYQEAGATQRWIAP